MGFRGCWQGNSFWKCGLSNSCEGRFLPFALVVVKRPWVLRERERKREKERDFFFYFIISNFIFLIFFPPFYPVFFLSFFLCIFVSFVSFSLTHTQTRTAYTTSKLLKLAKGLKVGEGQGVCVVCRLEVEGQLFLFHQQSSSSLQLK